jgi:hypothetical protein
MSLAPRLAPAKAVSPARSRFVPGAQRPTSRRLRAARPAKSTSNGITPDTLDALAAKISLAVGERISNANAELQVALEKERSARQVERERERSARQEKLSAFELALEKERAERQAALEKERSERQRQGYLGSLLFAAQSAIILLAADPNSIVSKLVQIVLVKVLPVK